MRKFENLFKDVCVVCFDLDDTLYSKEFFQLGAYQEISDYLTSKYSVKRNLFFDAMCNLSKKKYSNYPHLFEEVLSKFNLNREDVVKECVEVYRSYIPKKIVAHPYVYEFLSNLKKKKYKLAIITNGYPDTQKKKVEKLKLKKYFSKIVYADELGKNREYRKPHTKPYRVVLDHFGVKANQMVYIGDNPYVDFEGAVFLGIGCIRVLTGEFSSAPINSEMNDKVGVINNLEKLNEELFSV